MSAHRDTFRFFAVINVSIYDIDFAALFHSEIVSKT